MFIEVSNLKKSYASGAMTHEVLKGIGMKLERGRSVSSSDPQAQANRP